MTERQVNHFTQPNTNPLQARFTTARVKLRLRAGSAYAFDVGAADEEEEESLYCRTEGQPPSSSSCRTCRSVVRPFALLISEFETVQSIFSASLSMKSVVETV